MADFIEKFRRAFLAEDRWILYFKGLGVTLEVAFFAALIGLVIGTMFAMMRLSRTREGKMTPWAYIAGAYIDVIRGTPSVVQLLIMWFIIMKNSTNGVLIASLSFGINSGAYVAEIIRAGIMAVDVGQTEAGRSLGLSGAQTFFYIVLPQAIKNVLPPIGNEFIVLIKETSIAGYVAVPDLTYAGNRIRGATYSAFMPLIAVAIIYLVVVVGLTKLVGRLERRLRQSDGR